MWRWTRRVLLALVAVAIAGAVWQQVKTVKDQQLFPPPGVLVDIGDHKLHLWCMGEGEPTVLLEPSGLGTVRGFRDVLPLLAQHVRACAYDRAGMGWSEPSPRPLSSVELADDLSKLITVAKLKPPFVLAAASIGGLTAEMFARTHPDQVSGLVFIDAVDSGALPEVGPELNTLKRLACVAAPAAGVGLMRWLNPLQLSGEPAALTYRPSPFYAACSVLRELPESDRLLATAPPLLPDLPLLVLTHTQARGFLAPGSTDREQLMEPTWQRLQTALAARSTRSRQLRVEGSGHLIAGDRPDAVAQGILSLINP